jgi:hypothetical protein
VLVRAADHEDVVSPQPVIPGDDVGGHSEPGHMAQMPRATRVGPRDGEEDALWLAVREVVPPGGARLRTSYGEALGTTGARSGPARALAGRRRRARGERLRDRPAARAAAVSVRVTELGSRQAERSPFERSEADAPPSRRGPWLRQCSRPARRRARDEAPRASAGAGSTYGRCGRVCQPRLAFAGTQLPASRRPRRS